MAEYIEREAAIAEILKGTITTRDLYGMGVASGMDIALERVKSVPAADVEPVRHGRWEARTIPRSDPDGDWIALEYHCSLCNRLEYRKENYCPNCGAKMDGAG